MKLLNHLAPAAWKNWSSNIMTEITLKVTDESLLPMLRKLFRSMEGVEMVTHRRKIMEKLGMKSVSALTIYAVTHGYVDINKI